MDRRLLITVGDDPDFLYGVRFVSSFFTSREDLWITLLHVAPRFESMDAKEERRIHEMDQMLREIYARKGREALEASKRILVHQDFSSRRITTRLIHKNYGMVGDILEEARQAEAHAIVLGRRGYSVFEKALHPMLSEEVIDLEIEFPIWVCRRPERGLKNVLLCVDGSRSSFKAVEHVGFMTAREAEHKITPLCVADGTSAEVQEMLGAVKLKLMESGVGEERIGSLAIESREVGKAIRDEAVRGRYAVVALGRRGIQQDQAADNRFMGSKSLEMVEVLEKAALWVSK